MISLRRLLQPLSPLQRSYTTQPPAAPLRVSPSSSEKKQSPSLEALGYTIVDPDAQRTAIDAIGPTSFTVSGVRVTGSILLTSHFATLWNVSHISHLSPPAFALVKLLFPRPDFVLIGTGALSLPLSPELRQFFKEMNVRIDSMDTKNACQTFNVLNQEARSIAAALLPLEYREGKEGA